MTDDFGLRPERARILARLPQQGRLIRQSDLADHTFCGAGKDSHLACDGHATFDGLSTAAPRSETDDDRRLVRELKAEILALPNAVHGAPRPQTAPSSCVRRSPA